MHTSFTRRGSASPVRLGRAWLLHSYQWDVAQPPQFDWEELGYPIATKGGVSASPVRLGRAWLLHSYQRTWISLLSSNWEELGYSIATMGRGSASPVRLFFQISFWIIYSYFLRNLYGERILLKK